MNTVIAPALLSELKSFPHQGAIWDIIDNTKTGKIFKLPSDAVLLIENGDHPFVYIAGALDSESFDNVCSLLSHKRSPMLYCHPQYHSLFIRRGWDFHVRAAMSLKEPTAPRLINPAIEVQPVQSLEILKQCAWFENRAKLYGSEDNLLTHGEVYALRQGDRIVTEAYVRSGGGFAEIAVNTHPNFQGRGYATQVMSHVIRQCLDENVKPEWSCHVKDKASLYTGLKLGFEVTAYHTFLMPDWAEAHPLA